MGKASGVVMAGSVLAMAIGGLCFPDIAWAKPGESHVCPADRPEPPAVPPPLVIAERSMRGVAIDSSGASLPPRSSEPPSLMMGCVSRPHLLRADRVLNAQHAVSLAEAPESAAAIYKFKSLAERDDRIGQWLSAAEPDTSLSGDLVPATPMTIYIGGWENARWTFPGKRVVHAMYPENRRSGKLCLVRVDLTGRPEALAALNNWCMDRLDLWAD